MLDKILTDEKTFRIFCLILFAILFFIVLRKNKKEKFSQLSDANLQAIKNLGDFASNLQSGGTSGEYLFPGTTLNLNTANSKIKVNSIEIGGVNVDVNYLNNTLAKKIDHYTKTDADSKFRTVKTLNLDGRGAPLSVSLGDPIQLSIGSQRLNDWAFANGVSDAADCDSRCKASPECKLGTCSSTYYGGSRACYCSVSI